MIRSMTAYARADATVDRLSASVEIRTYNSRHLDLQLRLPHSYSGLEERIKARISGAVHRGRVELQIKIVDAGEAAFAYDVNLPAADAYREALDRLKTHLSLADAVPLSMIAGAGGIIKPAEVERDLDRAWTAVDPCLEAACSELDAMRRREGAFLMQDLEARLADIESAVETIAADASDLVAIHQQRLTERITALTRGLVELDPARIAQEAAILADRSDISEEIVRARSHLHQFRMLMAADEPAGRQLNFLLQEFNREFNTMGAKAGNAEISHTIVSVKSELEKMREQVQNVE